MKIIDRYILKEFLFPFIWCFVAFIFLYIIIDLFGHLDEIVKKHISAGTVFQYYLSFIPIVFVQTSPIATLVSTIYSISRLNRHNELIAMRANGIPVYRILMPLVIMGLTLSIIVFLLNEEIVPSASNDSSRIKERMESKGQPAAPQTDIALYGSHNRLYYIGSFNPVENIIKDITVLEHDENQVLKGRIFAKSGKWLDNRWVFYDCIVYNIDRYGKIIGEPAIFQKKDMDIEEMPDDLLDADTRIEFMRYSKLKEYINRFGFAKNKLARRLFVDLHYRIAFPFMSLITIFIGSPFALRKGRGGALAGFGSSIALGFIYYGVMSISIALGKAGFLLPLLSAWLANLLFGITGIILILRRY